jgi:hydroxymethylglutaryl-CoA lyase
VKRIDESTNFVKLIECPRDAWQGLKGHIPTYIKIDYLKALISAGFKHIDAVSFPMMSRSSVLWSMRRVRSGPLIARR